MGQSVLATEILACPPLSAGGLAGVIRARGNVPVSVGGACMFELTPADISETWHSTSRLKEQVAGAMVAELAHRLCAEIKDDGADEEILAGEAAACLFLAIRHRRIDLHEALEGCRVTFDDTARREQVECLT
jgi:stage V sporulation protein SpoVS